MGDCNFDVNASETMPVGRCPAGASPYGLLDMAGTAWEWCQTLWRADYRQDPDDDPYAAGPRVLRGGSFMNDAGFVRCAARAKMHPNLRDNTVGFRAATGTL
jgi:formylglycine-generating enzyme required for sulfatase activity